MANEPAFVIGWVDAGRSAENPPDPRHPSGADVNIGQPDPACSFPLPYPAPRCGQWVVQCNACGVSVLVTAAGRADDPRSARLPCNRKDQTDG